MHQPYPQGQRREEAELEWLLKRYNRRHPSGARRYCDAEDDDGDSANDVQVVNQDDGKDTVTVVQEAAAEVTKQTTALGLLEFKGARCCKGAAHDDQRRSPDHKKCI
jgi:hypothetical protein